MERDRKDTEGPAAQDADRTNVIPLGPRLAVAVEKQEPTVFFTDAERREIREMLVYYRKARPEFEKMKRGCPTARYLLDE